MNGARAARLPALDLEEGDLDVSRQALENLGIAGVLQEYRHRLLEVGEGRGARMPLARDVELHAACNEEVALALDDRRELVAGHDPTPSRQAPPGTSVIGRRILRRERMATLRRQFFRARRCALPNPRF